MMQLSLCSCFCPHQGHAADSAAGVNFEHALLQHALLGALVAQTDDEGLDPMHHLPPPLEQESRPLVRVASSSNC
jgi:hypothetical protein